MSNDFDPSILMEMLDRPIAYQRCFVTISKSVTAAVMLSQAIYWAKRTSDRDKWFWKSQAEWEEETGLTRSEQETARKKLAAIGVLEEKKQGLPCRLYFRVNTKKLYLQLIESNNQVCSNQSNQSAGFPQTGDRNLCVLESGVPANNLYTEITSENTSEIKLHEKIDLSFEQKKENLPLKNKSEDQDPTPLNPPAPLLPENSSKAIAISKQAERYQQFEARFSQGKPFNRHVPKAFIDAGYGEWHNGTHPLDWRQSLIDVCIQRKKKRGDESTVGAATDFIANIIDGCTKLGMWTKFQNLVDAALKLEQAQSQARSQPQQQPQPIELVASPPPAHLRERFRAS